MKFVWLNTISVLENKIQMTNFPLKGNNRIVASYIKGSVFKHNYIIFYGHRNEQLNEFLSFSIERL